MLLQPSPVPSRGVRFVHLALVAVCLFDVACAGTRLGSNAEVVGSPSATERGETTAPDAAIATVTGPDATPSGPSPLATDDETEGTDDSDEIDDGAESTPLVTGQVLKHPLDGWTKHQIEDELSKNPEALGSMSIGYTNAGALFNGVKMPEGDGWELVDPDHAWGTRETVDYVAHCLGRVSEQFPGAPTMYIGHISSRRGGHLSPHISHQAGRDVDISYYYLPGQARWYAQARASNLDRQRTWAFIKTLVTETDVELILMDRSIQRLMREYAFSIGEDREWVEQLFSGSQSLPPLIRHAKGHATHLHLRFYNPLAQETGRRTYDLLLARHIIEPPSYYLKHKVKEGETLIGLARKYRVTTKAIQQANGMKSDLLRATRDYKIPQRGGVKPGPRPVIPARRMPPERRTG
jgi:penicillin-insensitive murein endopeptidase